MEPFELAVTLDRPMCPATRLIEEGQRLLCQAPGGGVGPYGLVGPGLPAGWKVVASAGGTHLVGHPSVRCLACPAAALPAGAFPLAMRIRPGGVEMRIRCDKEDAGRVLEALERHGPRVVRRHRGQRLDVRVPLDGMTQRQWETLRTAVELGYFDARAHIGVREIADARGCSRSTAHEHLRKAIWTLARAAASTDPLEPGQVRHKEGR